MLSLTHFSDAQIQSQFKVQFSNCFLGKSNAAFLKENDFTFVREVLQLVVAKTPIKIEFKKILLGSEADKLPIE